MTDLRKAAEMALDAMLSEYSTGGENKYSPWDVIEALRQALAQPEQEPVSHLWECIGRWSSYLALNGEKANLAPPEWLVAAVKAATAQPEQTKCPRCGETNPAEVHTCSPQREWVGLTDEEIDYIFGLAYADDMELLRTIEAKLKDKNG